MLHIQHQPIHQKDYTPPDYLIEKVDVTFDLDPELTRVLSRLTIRANPGHGATRKPLILDGEALTLVSLKLDGVELPPCRYFVEEGRLTVSEVPDAFSLQVETEIKPRENTELSGLYISGPML